MSYDVGPMAGEREPDIGGRPSGYPLWEVFVRANRGLSHVHAGSVHAPDATSAVLAARDVYTRRAEGVSIWVVPSSAVHAADPDARGDFFEGDKPYRHPTFYEIPEEVGHM